MNLPYTADNDDVDRLFARLERAPVPDDLTAKVLASTVGQPTTRPVLAWSWLVALLGALAMLTLAGYQLGQSMAATDGLDVVEAVLGDAGLVATAPGDVLAALGDVVPWGIVALAGISAALLIWAAGHVIAYVPRSLGVRRTA
jgi:hypothetical protein